MNCLPQRSFTAKVEQSLRQVVGNYCCFHQSSAWAVDFRYVSAGECEEHPHERQRSHMGLNLGSKTFVTKPCGVQGPGHA